MAYSQLVHATALSCRPDSSGEPEKHLTANLLTQSRDDLMPVEMQLRNPNVEQLWYVHVSSCAHF